MTVKTNFIRKMPKEDIVETFTYFITQIKARHPELAFLHVVEARIAAGDDCDSVIEDTLDFIVSS